MPAAVSTLGQPPPHDPTLPPKEVIAKRTEAGLHALLLLLASLMKCENACHKAMQGLGLPEYAGAFILCGTCTHGPCKVVLFVFQNQAGMPESFWRSCSWDICS